MTFHVRSLAGAMAALALCVSAATAQLPSNAVDLGKLKIPEKIKSADVDPIRLAPADASLPTWEYKGVTYRGSKPGDQEEFMKDPDKRAAEFAQARWVANFIAAMSTVWCPVTDEVTPGGLTQWEHDGVTWESCCAFCDESVKDEDFPKALRILTERAKKSFELTGGIYVNNARSPLDGAIDPNAKPVDRDADGKPAGGGAEAPEPAWMKGKTLKPTYNEGIGLILQNRCVECHRPGGTGPMPFMAYADLKKWTKSIPKTVAQRQMPPWPADPAVGKFANSRALSKKEMDLIDQWAKAGFPEGAGSFKIDPACEAEWLIGKPDATFKLPAATLHAGASEAIQEFEIDSGLAADRWVVASEVHAGNEIATRYIDAGPLGALSGNQSRDALPPGMGRLVKAGSKIKVRVFFAKDKASEVSDPGATIGVLFAKDPASIKLAALEDPLANADFKIPPGAENFEAKAKFEFKEDGKILWFAPRMQARGKEVRCAATAPGGKRQELLRIANWNADYQMRYILAEPVAAPKGTIVEIDAKYDNGKLNAKNPDPGAEVTSGPGGELLEGWLGYSIGAK